MAIHIIIINMQGISPSKMHTILIDTSEGGTLDHADMSIVGSFHGPLAE